MSTRTSALIFALACPWASVLQALASILNAQYFFAFAVVARQRAHLVATIQQRAHDVLSNVARGAGDGAQTGVLAPTRPAFTADESATLRG